MRTFMIYIILFILFSSIGWILETIYIGIQTKKIANRGFLIGPYCPLYGVGSIAIMLSLSSIKENIILLFFASMILCCVLEYITGYAMEKMFKARWWDYSNYKFNINGRVCLLNAVLFGIGGIAVFEVGPILMDWITSLEETHLKILFSIVFIVFSTDFITTFNIITRLKVTALEIKKDSTDIISEKVIKKLIKKSGEFKRLILAFPGFKLIGYTKKQVKKRWFK